MCRTPPRMNDEWHNLNSLFPGPLSSVLCMRGFACFSSCNPSLIPVVLSSCPDILRFFFCFFFFRAAGEDATDDPMPGTDMLPPAVLWCHTIHPDEREETHLGLSCLWQEGPVWTPHYRRVRPRCQMCMSVVYQGNKNFLKLFKNPKNNVDILLVDLNIRCISFFFIFPYEIIGIALCISLVGIRVLWNWLQISSDF